MAFNFNFFVSLDYIHKKFIQLPIYAAAVVLSTISHQKFCPMNQTLKKPTNLNIIK